MGITIPSELDYVLDMFGFEWPNVDEDAIQEAATLVRGLRGDLQETLDDLQKKIDNDLTEAFTSKAAMAYIDAFSENRTQNMDTALDLLPAAADGLDLAADAVVALKLKVIAELTFTAAAMLTAAASAFVTGGASVVAATAATYARKKALDIATDLAVEQLVGQLLSMISEPLMETLASFGQSMLNAPLTTAAGGEQPKFDVSYDLMEQLATAVEDCGDEQKDIIDTFVSRLTALPITAE